MYMMLLDMWFQYLRFIIIYHTFHTYMATYPRHLYKLKPSNFNHSRTIYETHVWMKLLCN
ncbi:hypothetical protein HanRHA438_Chr10g0471801 [Helianthus annuus]|nr:hypothetical protein HanIR_Chr10g0494561 [Helianthus annuus]KAJ0881206.1 hypothetical protein HanRHA438_Chr10g0471801 [Helianthus annuus]